MTKADLEIFIKLQEQLIGMFEEMSTLSKKSPDTQLNKFKIKLVNQVIINANSILDDRNKPFIDFEKFDEDDLPSNSDVVVILSQYLKCLEKFRSENITQHTYQWYWVIDGVRSEIKTHQPHIGMSE